MKTQAATWTNAEILELITAAHLISSKEPNADEWEDSEDENAQEWARLSLRLSGGDDGAETRRDLKTLVRRILGLSSDGDPAATADTPATASPSTPFNFLAALVPGPSRGHLHLVR